MIKIKKILFFGVAFSALSALCFVPISCSELKHDKQDIKIWRNYGPHAVPYQFDNSWNTVDSSIVNQDIGNKLDANLFRIQTLGKLELNPKTKEVISPSFSRYKMEYADKISFVFKNKNSNTTKEVVFDSDDVNQSIKNNRLQIDKKTKLPIGVNKSDIKLENFFLKSDNKKSINSSYFKKISKGNYLDNANNIDSDFKLESIKIDIKKNIPWISLETNNGVYSPKIWKDKNNKVANVEAKDFYYSFIRSYLFSQNNRWSTLGGGSKEIDNKVIQELGHVHKYGKHDRFENLNMIENFGFDLDKLLSQDYALSDTVDNQAFIIHTNKSNQSDFYSLFNALFVNNSVFSAAPSKFIDQKRDTKDYVDYGQSGLSKQVLYYNYGKKKNGSDVLYASAYIPSKYLLVNEKYIEFQKNAHYVDKDFVNSSDNLKKIGIQYSDGTTLDDNVKTQSLVNSFLNDNYNILDLYYDSLPTSIKKSLSSNINYILDNKKELMGSYLPTVVPSPGALDEYTKYGDYDHEHKHDHHHEKHLDHNHNHGHEHHNEHVDLNYTYNNSYSLLLWNSSIDKINKGATDKSLFETYFSGNGLKFRNAIQSAINWNSFSNEVSNSTAREWFSTLSPNAKIGGSNQDSSESKKLLDNFSQINSVNLVGTSYSQNPESNKKNNHLSIEEKLKSSIYEQAKIELNKALDDFISKNPNNALLEKEKVNGKYTFKWALFCHSWTSASSPSVIRTHQEIAKLIKNMSSKYNLEVEIKIPTDHEAHELLKSGFSSSTRYKQDYKYDGIGSGIELLSLNNGTGILPAFSLYSSFNLNNPSAKLFPEFKKISDELKEYINPFIDQYNNQYKDTKKHIKKFENWFNYSNLEWNNQLDTFDEKNTNLFSKISSFFHKYQNKTTNEELLKLAMELNTIVGNSLELTHQNSHYIEASKYLKMIISNVYAYPSVPSGSVFIEDIRIKA